MADPDAVEYALLGDDRVEIVVKASATVARTRSPVVAPVDQDCVGAGVDQVTGECGSEERAGVMLRQQNVSSWGAISSMNM